MRRWSFLWIGLIFCMVALGCGRELPPTQGQPGSLNAAVLPNAQTDVVSTFTLVGHTDAGRKKWEIEGETADLMAQTVELSPVKATSYGKVQVYLTAQEGQFNKDSQDVHLEGDVVVTTSDGAKMTTDSLDWTAQKETGTSPDRVKVTRPGMEVEGLGGTGFPKLKQVRLEKDVTVILDGENGEKTIITCDGPMEVDYGRNKARFWKNVQVRDAKGLIQSDRMDVTLTKARQIEKTTFWGHVEIHQEGRVATANRAIYWQPEGRVRLIGNPELMMASKEVEG